MNWFKKLSIYRITDSEFQRQLRDGISDACLAEREARRVFGHEHFTEGFCCPVGDDGPLAYSANGFLLLAVRREERILPGGVVRDALKEKVQEIEAQQMRKVYKKERDQLKDEIIHSLLPRAFVRKTVTRAAVDPAAGLIYVDGSYAQAERVLSLLREALGSLPLRPISVKHAPAASFTDWVRSSTIGCGFSLGDRASMADTGEDGGKASVVRQDLGSDEVQGHLAAGKLVTGLALDWSEKLSLRIDDKLAITSLKFADLLQDQAESDGGDDAEQQQAASFVLMMLTFREFVPALLEVLGGEDGQEVAK